MIGIITFHAQYNCGSALQAFALQSKMQELGYKCKILKYYYEGNMREYNVRLYTKKLKIILFDIYTLINCLARKKSYNEFQKRNLNLTVETRDWHDLRDISKSCDVLVCGSDQIWNVELTHGLHPAYFLKFANDNQRLIAYAPSVALNTIPERFRVEFQETLKRFDYISTRELQTANELKEITGRSVPNVLDPTLLHDVDFYNNLINNNRLQLPDRYVFMYCLHYNSLDKLRQIAESYALKYNASIVYFNKYNIHKKLYKKNMFRYGPEAFLLGIKKAEFIVADSYHAALFSILYKKEFLIYALNDSKIRMVTLFKKLGIEGHFINDENESFKKINYNIVHKRLKKEQKDSIEFLKKALGDCACGK